MMFIVLLCLVGLIVVGGYFGFKQLRKTQEDQKILHHRQSQSVTLGDVDSRVEVRVEAAVTEAMSLERRRLEEMYQAAMEQVVEAEAVATQRARELERPVKRKRGPRRERKPTEQSSVEQSAADQSLEESVAAVASDVSSTYELPAASACKKKKKKKKQERRSSRSQTQAANVQSAS